MNIKETVWENTSGSVVTIDLSGNRRDVQPGSVVAIPSIYDKHVERLGLAKHSVTSAYIPEGYPDAMRARMLRIAEAIGASQARRWAPDITVGIASMNSEPWTARILDAVFDETHGYGQTAEAALDDLERKVIQTLKTLPDRTRRATEDLIREIEVSGRETAKADRR